MKEKKFIVRPQNNGKVFGLHIMKVNMSDESLTDNNYENIHIGLSDCEGFNFKKDSRFEIIIKQIR